MNIFNRHYLHYRTLDRDIKKAVNSHYHIGMDVLDAGSGDGRYEELFTRKDYHAIDKFPKGKAKYADLCDPNDYLISKCGGEFDLIVCSQVLEHVDDIDIAVDSISFLLKSGGVAVITVPFSWELHGEPHDYRRFTKHGLGYALKRAGLGKVEIKSQTNSMATIIQLFINYATSKKAPIRWMAKASVPFLNLLGLIAETLGKDDKLTLNYIAVCKK